MLPCLAPISSPPPSLLPLPLADVVAFGVGAKPCPGVHSLAAVESWPSVSVSSSIFTGLCVDWYRVLDGSNASVESCIAIEVVPQSRSSDDD